MDVLNTVFLLLRQELTKKSAEIVNGFQNNTLTDAGLRHAAGKHYGYQEILQILQGYENEIRQGQRPTPQNSDGVVPANTPAVQSVSLDPAPVVEG